MPIKNKILYLFDVDNTLTHSGGQVSEEMMKRLQELRDGGHELGIVGGGTHVKIMDQIHGNRNGNKLFRHVFSECGCVYYRDDQLHHCKDMRNNHPRARVLIDALIKRALGILAAAPYPLGGHMIDMRTGIVYISCVGMTATPTERRCFLDHHLSYREYLLGQLRGFLYENDWEQEIEVKKGGSVGIAIFPRGWDKAQVMDMLPDIDTYQDIYYFGDSTGPDGNDECLLKHPRITHPIVVKNPEDTISILQSLIKRRNE